MRTNEFSSNHKRNEQGYNYRQDIVTTKLYCSCQDCMKYCDHSKPVQCIDPFLMDMRHTYWIYHGLVTASRTERAVVVTDPVELKKIMDEQKAKETANKN